MKFVLVFNILLYSPNHLIAEPLEQVGLSPSQAVDDKSRHLAKKSGSALPTSVKGVIAFLMLDEGKGTSTACAVGSACGAHPLFFISSSETGTWNSMGYSFSGTSQLAIPDNVMNEAQTIIIVSGVEGTGYRSLIGCGDGGLLLDQSPSDLTLFNLSGVSVVTSRTLPGRTASYWSMGRSRMISWVRGTDRSTDPDRLYLDAYRMPMRTPVANASIRFSGSNCGVGNLTANNLPLNNTVHLALFLNHRADGNEVGTIMAVLKNIDNQKARLGGLDTRDLLTLGKANGGFTLHAGRLAVPARDCGKLSE